MTSKTSKTSKSKVYQSPVDRIISYESGELSEPEIIELFQDLIDSGVIYHLQGSYQRMAGALLRAGLIKTGG